jgi:hypothetical protein
MESTTEIVDYNKILYTQYKNITKNQSNELYRLLSIIVDYILFTPFEYICKCRNNNKCNFVKILDKYIVGGYVRDIHSGILPHDIDIFINHIIISLDIIKKYIIQVIKNIITQYNIILEIEEYVQFTDEYFLTNKYINKDVVRVILKYNRSSPLNNNPEYLYINLDIIFAQTTPEELVRQFIFSSDKVYMTKDKTIKVINNNTDYNKFPKKMIEDCMNWMKQINSKYIYIGLEWLQQMQKHLIKNNIMTPHEIKQLINTKNKLFHNIFKKQLRNYNVVNSNIQFIPFNQLTDKIKNNLQFMKTNDIWKFEEIYVNDVLHIIPTNEYIVINDLDSILHLNMPLTNNKYVIEYLLTIQTPIGQIIPLINNKWSPKTHISFPNNFHTIINTLIYTNIWKKFNIDIWELIINNINKYNYDTIITQTV